MLAEDGVDPDSKDNYGQTPLSWAAMNGHEAVVKLLLAEDGVDPDPKNDYGMTPLSLAVSNGHEAVVKSLQATGKVGPWIKHVRDYALCDYQTQFMIFEQQDKRRILKALLG
jgi:ankyrin repeat protein